MIRHLLRAVATVIVLAVTLGTATAATASASPPARLAPPKSYYLALGDSIAYGFQTSKALAGLPPQAFNTGYADLFAAQPDPAEGTDRHHQLFLPRRVNHHLPAAVHLEDIRARTAQRLRRFPARCGAGVPGRPPRQSQPDHVVAERQRR